jgi:hypothetical protein
MRSTRKIISRVHAVMIIIMGCMFSIVSTYGRYTGTGIFGWAQQNPWAHAGLIQAYALIAVVGLSIWFGTAKGPAARWHLIGALAHVSPLAANIMIFPYAGVVNFETYSQMATVMHTVWIIIELSASAYSVWWVRDSASTPVASAAK